MKEIIVNVDNYNENSIKTIEGDNLSEVYKIYICKNKRRIDLTNKIAIMAYVNEYGNKKSNILALNITNASQGEIELPITNVISSENGVYACQIAIYGENNSLEQTAPFNLIVENNIFSKISNAAINSSDFQILSEAIKTTNEYGEKLKEGTENIELQYANKLNELDTLKATKTEVEVERKRIDLLTKIENGQTDGNTELLDIRIGEDGIIYDTAGNSIRNQFKNTNTKVTKNATDIEKGNVGDNSLKKEKFFGETVEIFKNLFGNFDANMVNMWGGFKKVINQDGSITISYTNNQSNPADLIFYYKLPFLLKGDNRYFYALDIKLNNATQLLEAEQLSFKEALITGNNSNTSSNLLKSPTIIDNKIRVGERKNLKYIANIDKNKTDIYNQSHYLCLVPIRVAVGQTISLTFYNCCIYNLGLSINPDVDDIKADEMFGKYGYSSYYEKIIDVTAVKAKELEGFDLQSYDDFIDKLSRKKIICLGDSLTQGAGGENSSPDGSITTYPKILQQLSGITTLNCGVGGDSVIDVFARLGADAIQINNITVPQTTTPVDLGKTLNTVTGKIFKSNIVENGIGNEKYKINPVFIDGIEGNLLKSRSTGNYYFTRKTEGEIKKIDRPTLITTDLMENLINKQDIYIFYVGQNGGYTDIEDWISQITRAVNYIGCEKYVVIAYLTDRSYSTMNDTYNKFRKEFGSKFIDIHRYILDFGLQDSNLTPNDEDTTNIENGICPPSLKHDKVHFNHYGYTIIGNLIYKRLKELYPKYFSNNKQ